MAKGEGGPLVLKGMHSYAQVYVDQKPGRRARPSPGPRKRWRSPGEAAAATLDILVENTGRVNYSHAIRGERDRPPPAPSPWLASRWPTWSDVRPADGRPVQAAPVGGALQRALLLRGRDDGGPPRRHLSGRPRTRIKASCG
ncbi:hypothetical protein ACRAWD_09625 [Caulobacter segnis]